MSEKRERSPSSEDNVSQTKRKSRFSEVPHEQVNQAAEIAAAVAKAQSVAKTVSKAQPTGTTELDARRREIANQIASATMLLNQQKAAGGLNSHQLSSSGLGVLGVMGPTSNGMPLMPSMIDQVGSSGGGKKQALDLSIRLDEHGRAIDSSGNLIEVDLAGVKTLKVNNATNKAKVNPYLSHMSEENGVNDTSVDPRIRLKSRSLRGKKSFAFHKEGVFVKQNEILQVKEERKQLSGFSSGRNKNAYTEVGIVDPLLAQELEYHAAAKAAAALEAAVTLPPPADLTVPVCPPPSGLSHILAAMQDHGPEDVETWDAVFLPVQDRKNPKATYDMLKFENNKFHNLVLHPAPVLPPGFNEAPPPPMKVFLLPKERKRIRRQAREERRNETRDKILLGMLPAPEPKLKLGNFMKVLGDQAVADPSKIERKVMEQVQARVTNHEMRNQARKLTPAERKDKKRKKLEEDTSREVTVAVFRVKDLSDQQHQFKVDMNATQNSLTGGVLVCKGTEDDMGQMVVNPSEEEAISVVVVEGGPKAIKRYTKLMTRRIKWNGDESESESESEDEGGAHGHYYGKGNSNKGNQCNLVWTGTVARRNFNSFKFQETNSARAARKVMESKGVAHYWDMAVRFEKEVV